MKQVKNLENGRILPPYALARVCHAYLSVETLSSCNNEHTYRGKLLLPCGLMAALMRMKATMSIRPSYIFAFVVVVALGMWFAFNSAGVERDLYADLENRDEAAAQAPSVVIRTVRAEPHVIRLTAYGRTEPNRVVEVKAKTAASLIATPIAEGTYVRAGTVICRQDVDARQARVDQARAQLTQAEGDLKATLALVDQGFRSSTSIARDQAMVDGARAQLKSAEIELSNVVLRAPFDGIYERRLAEIGDYLAPGQPCASIVELNPLKVETELTELQVGSVSVGQDVEVRLATGQTVMGTVQFVESVANPATRTFLMETRLPNQNRSLKAGVSARIGLATGETMASLVPSGILTLNDEGRIGVRYVDADNRVRFAPTTQIDETETGIWLSGLPDVADIIVEGQDFVSIGSEVTPRQEAALNTSPAATLVSTQLK